VKLIAVAALLAVAAPTAWAQAPGNATAGAAVFKRACAVCHSIDPARQRPTGPNLNGVAGRKAAAGTFPRYSAGLRASNIIWTDANLDRYLANPRDVVKGGTMLFRLPNPKDRADVIAYLKTVK
jgi:cytochrome c